MTETDQLYRLSCQIDYWGRKIAELREIAGRQVARWLAKAARGSKAEDEPKVTLRELDELNDVIETYAMYDQGGQSIYQERLAYELAERSDEW